GRAASRSAGTSACRSRTAPRGTRAGPRLPRGRSRRAQGPRPPATGRPYAPRGRRPWRPTGLPLLTPGARAPEPKLTGRPLLLVGPSHLQRPLREVRHDDVV